MLATYPTPTHMKFMTSEAKPKMESKWARVLRTRRVSLGYRSQEALALKTQEGKDPKAKDVLSQRTVSAIETGDQLPTSMTSARLLTYIQVLEWTPEEFHEQTGLKPPFGSAPKPNPLENFTVSENFITYPVYTSASAGTGEPEIIEGEVAAIPERALRARGVGEHNRHEIMPVKVNGNCLVSQNVRFSDKNISHGDYVFVHLKAPPENGDRVCCFDHSDDQLIIKFFQEAQDPNQPDFITFFDARGMQYVRKTSDIDYIGVVFWRSGGL